MTIPEQHDGRSGLYSGTPTAPTLSDSASAPNSRRELSNSTESAVVSTIPTEWTTTVFDPVKASATLTKLGKNELFLLLCHWRPCQVRYSVSNDDPRFLIIMHCRCYDGGDDLSGMSTVRCLPDHDEGTGTHPAQASGNSSRRHGQAACKIPIATQGFRAYARDGRY